MTAEGWLDRGARAALPFPATVPRRFPTGAVADGSSQPVLAAVTAELAELGISDRELNRGGLRVVTTLDPHRQRLAVDAARGPLNGRSGNLRSAMVAIDPNTGEVLAYYGGDDGRGRLAADASRRTDARRGRPPRRARRPGVRRAAQDRPQIGGGGRAATHWPVMLDETSRAHMGIAAMGQCVPIARRPPARRPAFARCSLPFGHLG